jgi:predicted DCC family thiol-disulfide oxidoreductase YuxK
LPDALSAGARAAPKVRAVDEYFLSAAGFVMIRNSSHSGSKCPAGPEPPVIFFDGVCGLCNTFVDWVLRTDKPEVFRFAPLQGDTAKKRLGPLAGAGDPAGWSVVYQDEAGTYTGAEACLRIARRLGGIWSAAAAVLLRVPSGVRDRVYGFIARRRYRWFGKLDSCRRPGPAERSRFLR